MKSFISPFKKVIFFSFILLMIFAGKESGCGCEDESKLQFFQLGQGNPGGNGLGTSRGEEEIGQSQKGKRIDESENASLFQPETKSDFFTQISSASNASGSNTNGSPIVESPLLSQNLKAKNRERFFTLKEIFKNLRTIEEFFRLQSQLSLNGLCSKEAHMLFNQINLILFLFKI